MKLPFLILAVFVVALFPSSCSNINCPLDNVVMMQCNFYASENHQELKLADVLSVCPANSDTVLINHITNVSSILLPLREGADRDTLLFQLTNSAGQAATDTLFVTHTRTPHFESVDCPASVFHNISQVSFTSHPLSELPLTIDSISLVRSIVNYDDIENVRIYLRSTSQQ